MVIFLWPIILKLLDQIPHQKQLCEGVEASRLYHIVVLINISLMPHIVVLITISQNVLRWEPLTTYVD